MNTSLSTQKQYVTTKAQYGRIIADNRTLQFTAKSELMDVEQNYIRTSRGYGSAERYFDFKGTAPLCEHYFFWTGRTEKVMFT
ncbi:hypothetical protein D7Y05_04850 [bacterium 1XD42-54]|nr:hypothetical protein D7Y05_04850 [bacterium 1XD42-54]